MASASHASSADEIANLLARLQTTSELTARYDSAVRNYNSSKRLLTGPSRKQIAKQCKTVGLEATFLGAQLCIDLMRLAHLLKNKGTSESDAHKKKIMKEWTRMTDEFKEGSGCCC